MKKFIFYSLILLILLPGCAQKVQNWALKRFNQGCKIDTYECTAYQYIRTLKVYDQFRTLGIFNAMWNSDVVRNAYVNVHAQKHVLSQESYENMLNSEMMKARNKIAFYFLVWYPKWCGGEFDKPNSRWLVFLKLGDKAYSPKLIKKVELPCEYVIFFNKFKDPFKRSYYVEFDALDENGKNILEGQRDMVLCFRSYERQGFMRWSFDQNGCLLNEHYDEVRSCYCFDACGDCQDLNIVN